ncbi:MAG: haloacid dehalogenase-like hydrolase [Deltaproteobacteria bacterium]|nr:haloacid dehalogenase-like hydrolase [Deltaproteobacteria bacterium]
MRVYRLTKSWWAGLALLCLAGAALAAPAAEPLPSWRDGAAKQAILEFVAQVTKQGGPAYVPPAERVAVFDNDGTLWAEKPFHFQLAFALGRVKEMAPQHPEWAQEEPFAAGLSGDRARMAKLHQADLMKIVAATHAGQTTEGFDAAARAWLKTARHPTKDRLYTQMVYQPMLELLSYLTAHDFKVFIVSGGGVDFLRAFALPVYGIPPERVIGSSLQTKWEYRDGRPVIVKLPQINSLDDKEGKPLNIELHLGRRPILAAGNSDGDLQMLEWTAAGHGARLMLLVHYDDPEREWAYDRKSAVGRLDQALDLAGQRGWRVISMKNDFAVIFPGN